MRWVRMRRWLSVAVVGVIAGVGEAAVAQVTPVSVALPVVMMSDFHFDPYHDPAKFEKLRAAPVTAWRGILSKPDTRTRSDDYANLMKACFMRGVDTPWTLLESSLMAAHAQSPHALFVTVSGDLLVHNFDCRFHALAKRASDADESAFAAKTVAYVASELHRVFGKTPVYITLGNNDTGCEDYHETPNSAFLRSTANTFGDDIASRSARGKLMNDFPAQGDYSVALPKQIVRGRLIVMQDVFQSPTYTLCKGKPDATPGDAQIAWLRAELTAAHARGEQVWVMAHIPAGVNVYATLRGKADVCAGQSPEMFLRDDKLVDTLTDFASDVRLVIFAHTHQDEMALLDRGDGHRIPAKLVASVTPINGNAPSFTLGDVDAATAELKDYRLIKADNSTGAAANWAESYRFSTTYHQAGYGVTEVAALIEGFTNDRTGLKSESLAYQGNFFVGGGLGALAVHLAWSNYVCAMAHDTAAEYRDCVCGAKP